MHIRQIMDRAATRHPDTAALTVHDGETGYTYRELVETAKRVGGGLHDVGGDDVTVGLYTENNPAAFLALFGAWWTGMPVCEIKPRTTAANLPYFVDDGEVDVLVYHHSRRDRVAKARDELDAALVQIGGEAPDWAVSFDELRGHDPAPAAEADDDAIATIGYTSGTTGKPKGVPHTHDRIYHTALILLIRDEVRDGDRIGLIYPYYGVGHLHLVSGMMIGATVVLPAERNAEAVLRMIEEERITTTGGVPTQLKGLVESDAISEYDTSSLRYVHTGSGLMTEAVYEKVKEQLCETICTSYGSSEAGETTYSLQDSIAIGKPQPFHDIRIVQPGEHDPEQEVKDGELGELIVAADGPTVFDGYWKKPEKTEEVLHDGWYFTGDVVMRDEDGMIWFKGRTDDMIISGGENIAPGEVEDALLTHPAVVHAGAVGVPDETWGEKVVGFVEVDGDVDADELDRHCRDSDLEDFKRPKDYVFVDDMPVTKTGGVKRADLRDMWDEQHGQD